MKKIYFPTFILILLAFCSNSQSTYFKLLKEDTTVWQHFYAVPGVEQNPKPINAWVNFNDYPVAVLDTITFGSTIYRKTYQLNFYSLNYGSKSLIGYMREDTIAKRIYFRDPQSTIERLLYDFSLSVNDSVYLTFPNTSSQSGFYRCDSIKLKNEVSGPRKHFYLRKHLNNTQPTLVYLDIIEGVGSTYHVLYIYDYWSFYPYGLFSWMNSSCNHPWGFGVSCKHDDLKKQFQSCTFVLAQQNSCINPIDSCDYRNICGGLKNNDWDKYVKVGPNPTNDKIKVSIEHSFETINCSVTDMTGKIIFTLPKESMSVEKNSFSFSTKDLAPGIYILQVKLNETLIKRPIVVQH